MRQTIAIFLDAYRELNAKRMFWATMVLSAVFILAFAMCGVDAHGITFLKWRFEQRQPATFYKAVFLSAVMIGFWLTWGATILAIISTAGLFPDFIAGGSIDLYLSKPISRLRLFVTKYLAGLLFAALQVTVFTVGMFLVVGIRLGEWKPSLFLAIPIVICFFSYLFAISVLLGVTTRSTVTALLLTLLCWLFFWGIQKTEGQILFWKYAQDLRADRFEARVKAADAELTRLSTQPTIANPFGLRSSSSRQERDKYVRLHDDAERAAKSLANAHRLVYGLATVFPKTGPTIDLLDRSLIREKEVRALSGADEPPETPSFVVGDEGSVMNDFGAQVAAQGKLVREFRRRSLGWVIGTSLLFEGVVISLAAWRFCRRDY